MGKVKNSFGNWSAEERNSVTRKTNEAIKNGDILPPSAFTCKMCGRGKNEVYRMDYHHESYDDPIKYLIPLCSGCHMKLHKQFKREELAKENMISKSLNQKKHYDQDRSITIDNTSKMTKR